MSETIGNVKKGTKYSEEFIESKLISIVATQLDIDEKTINKNSSFSEDLGLDSLDLVELVMTLEDEFGYNIPDEDAEKIETVSDAISFIVTAQDNLQE